MCEGLLHIHSSEFNKDGIDECGIAYLDIKPDNILVDESANLKLLDFGLSQETVYEKATGRRLVKFEDYAMAYRPPEYVKLAKTFLNDH